MTTLERNIRAALRDFAGRDAADAGALDEATKRIMAEIPQAQECLSMRELAQERLWPMSCPEGIG